MKESFKLKTREKKKVSVDVFYPESDPKAIVQIAHGMAEHKKRYHDFAYHLTARGFLVYVHDHRGHGKSKIASLPRGLAGINHSWKLMQDDLMQLHGFIEARHEGVPIFLLGQSMGSMLAMEFAAEYGEDIAGLLLSGIPADPGFRGRVMQVVAGAIVLVKGSTNPSSWLDQKLFGDMNGFISKPRTRFDWLTRDEKEVDKYIEDPWCGYVYPAAFYYELIKGALRAWRKETFRYAPDHLPVLLFGGSDDPAGNFGESIKKAAFLYREAGKQDVIYKIYQDGRHEMLNELNRKEVYEDIVSWMEEKIQVWMG